MNLHDGDTTKTLSPLCPGCGHEPPWNVWHHRFLVCSKCGSEFWISGKTENFPYYTTIRIRESVEEND